MIKTLQKKFIITAMIAISVLIVVLLGTVNVANVIRINNRNNSLMEELAGGNRMMSRPELNFSSDTSPDFEDGFLGQPEVQPGGDFGMPTTEDRMTDTDAWIGPRDQGGGDSVPDNGNDNQDQGFRIFKPILSEDDKMSAVYFIVRLDADKNVVMTELDRISSVDEEAAADYAVAALSKTKSKGKMEHYRYLVEKSPDGMGYTVVFLDVKSHTQSILAVVIVSIGIGIISWLLMLLLVVLLSKKAIRPIAENIERQKQFITDAGHEIKTPLAIILANTDAMELHNGENKWSKNIRKQTTRLSELMQRMLALAKMDEGVAKLKFEELDISKLVKELATSFSEPAKKKGIRINKDMADGLIRKADKESMTQLINILIDNAVKYADDDSVIDVVLAKHDKKIRFTVDNVCSSLPDVPADKLFDRFYRGDSARTQKGGGFGIGLSVAQEAARAHKGSIKAVYKDGNVISFEVEL